MEKLVILDGHAIIHRAFHAIQPLTTSKGELINAVFGFTSMMFNVLEIEKPDCIAVALDKKGKTFRHHADENYKATRAKTAPELISQIGRVYQVIRAFSIPLFAENGFEADDLIASIVEKLKDADARIIIVSGDRDLLQLVDAKVSLHDLSGGYRKAVQFTPDEVRAKYGFEAKYIADYKGLAGDASDNIKGVGGVGEKTASALIARFGSLEKIYENLDKVQKNLRTKLEQDKENAFFSKKLATLRRDAQIDFDLSDCKLKNFNRDEVLKLFEELEFKSLKKRFEKLFPPPKPFEQTSLF